MRRFGFAIGMTLMASTLGCGGSGSRHGLDGGPDGGVDAMVDGARPDAGVCGDGLLAASEACDDMNDVADDGCTACGVDDGFHCTGEPSVCEPGTSSGCGDGLRGPGEECDDGNTAAGDGCSALCRMEGCADADMDGYTDKTCGGLDCDDTNPGANPGVAELCGNAVDEDCDGTVQPTVDADHDGSFCTTDCDDADPTRAPALAEACNDGIDNDCDASTSDLFDADMDSYDCDIDCDDTSADVSPSASELCGNGLDDDCDATTVDLFDADMDGADCAVDCNDADPAIGDTPGGCAYLYFEDFESSDGDWIAGGTSPSWAYGTPAGTFIPAAVSGTHAWVTNLSGNYNVSENSTLTSPTLDLSAITDDPILAFHLIYKTENSLDRLTVEVSLDGGSSWLPVGPSTGASGWYASGGRFTGTSGDPGQWRQVRTQLTGSAGQSDVRVRLLFHSDGSVQYEGAGVDDVLVAVPYHNLSAVRLTGPGNACALSSAESVALEVRNDSTGTVDSFDLSLVVDGAAPTVESVTHSLAPGESYVHSFAAPVDLSAFGVHTLSASVVLTGDQDASDDTLSVDITHVPTIMVGAALDFEADGAGFTVEGTSPSWAWGVPSGSFIPAAASGTHAWVTNPAGNYNTNELSYLVSPCIDLAAATTDPVLAFSHIYKTESIDDGWVDLSVDGGATWTKLGASGEGSGWYNDASGAAWNGTSGASGVWRLAYHTLTGAAGQADVRVRFGFDSDGSVQYDGFGVDDFALVDEVIDGAVNSVATAVGCGLGAAESVRVVVQNNSSASVADLPIDVVIDGAAPVRELVPGPIAPSATAAYTLTTTADLSALGTHTVRVTAVLAGDITPGNDAREITVQNDPILALPFSTDFEADAAGFGVSGTNASWAWGAPSGSFIPAAASGTGAWVTNLSGDYNTNELSYLTSPCFDATSAASLFLRFKHIYKTETYPDRGWVEVSTNGGASWSKLGVSGMGGNWYSDASSQWWSGMSGVSGVWRDAFYDVTPFVGAGTLRFRFVFRSDGSVQYDGFGVDDLSVAP